MSDRAFIIDIGRCTGCGACLIACKDRADMPDELDLLRVETTESGTFPTPEVTHRVVHCFHCARAPCVEICPAGALSHAPGGTVALNRDACVACGRCSDVCPFGAVAMVPDGETAKCDGCTDEVAAGLDPTCVRACPMRALAYAVPPDPAPPTRMREPPDHGAGAAPRACYLRRR